MFAREYDRPPQLHRGHDMEFHIEWVAPVISGSVIENTFSASVPMISMGGAPTMTGNVTVP